MGLSPKSNYEKKIVSCFDIGEVPRSPRKWNWNWLYFLPFIFTFEQGDPALTCQIAAKRFNFLDNNSSKFPWKFKKVSCNYFSIGAGKKNTNFKKNSLIVKFFHHIKNNLASPYTLPSRII